MTTLRRTTTSFAKQQSAGVRPRWPREAENTELRHTYLVQEELLSCTK